MLTFDTIIGGIEKISNCEGDFSRCLELNEEVASIENESSKLLLQIQHLPDSAQNMQKELETLSQQITSIANNYTMNDYNEMQQRGEMLYGALSANELLNKLSETCTSIAKTGGMQEKPIEEFFLIKSALEQKLSHVDKIDEMTEKVQKSQVQQIELIRTKMKDSTEKIREIIGWSNNEIAEYQKQLSEINSVKGFTFADQTPQSVLLCTMQVKLTQREQAIINAVFPEIKCKNNLLDIPFSLDTKIGISSKTTNLMIYFDGTDSNQNYRVAAMVHKFIFRIVNGFPVAEMNLHVADLTTAKTCQFDVIVPSFKNILDGMSDQDLSTRLKSALCNDDMSYKLDEMVMNALQCYTNNQIAQGPNSNSTCSQHLFVYFGLTMDNCSETFEKYFLNFFEMLNTRGSFGVYNLVVIDKKEFDKATNAAKSDRESVREKADRFLRICDAASKLSESLFLCGNGVIELRNQTQRNNDFPQLYLGKLPASAQEYIQYRDNVLSKFMRTILDLNTISTSQTNVISTNEEIQALQLKNKIEIGFKTQNNEKVFSNINSNFVLVETDGQLSDDDCSNILSTILLNTMSCYRPGSVRLDLPEAQNCRMILPVTNGLVYEHDNKVFTLIDRNNERLLNRGQIVWSIVEKNARLVEEYRNKTQNRNSTYRDIVNEDPTKAQLIVYGEYDFSSGNEKDKFKEIFNYTVQSVKNGYGVQLIALVKHANQSDYEEISRTMGESTNESLTGTTLLSKNHSLFDFNGNNLQIHAISDRSIIQNIANNMTERFAREDCMTPNYEDVGFGRTTFADDQIDNIITIPIGYSDGKICSVSFDSRDGVLGYIVQGVTGSGKSSLFHSLIINGSMMYSPETLQFYLMDLKPECTEFNCYSSKNNPLPHIKAVTVQNCLEDVELFFAAIEDEISARGAIFKKAGNFRNIHDYNRFVATNRDRFNIMPRIIVVMDECQRAFAPNGELNTSLINKFDSITRVARAFGIFFIISSQVFSSGLISKIGSQLAGRICFKMSTPEQAMSILSNNAAREVGKLRAKAVACISNDYGETCQSVRISYIADRTIDFSSGISKYIRDIRNVYSKYPIDLVEIGDDSYMRYDSDKITKASSTIDDFTGVETTYIPIGQNAISGRTQNIECANRENNTTYIYGNNQYIISNILASAIISILKQDDSEVWILDNNVHNQLRTELRRIDNQRLVKYDDYKEMLYLVYKEYKSRVESGYCSKKVFVVIPSFDLNIFEERREQQVSNFTSTTFAMPPRNENKEHFIDVNTAWPELLRNASCQNIFMLFAVQNPSLMTDRLLSHIYNDFKNSTNKIIYPCAVVASEAQNHADSPMMVQDARRHVAYKTPEANSQGGVCYYFLRDERQSNAKFRPYCII